MWWSLTGLSQAYQFDCLPEIRSLETAEYGDLVFYKGTYFNPASSQAHDITHVEIFTGGTTTVGSRSGQVVSEHKTYKFPGDECAKYHSVEYMFRSIDTWLDGVCRSFCKLHHDHPTATPSSTTVQHRSLLATPHHHTNHHSQHHIIPHSAHHSVRTGKLHTWDDKCRKMMSLYKWAKQSPTKNTVARKAASQPPPIRYPTKQKTTKKRCKRRAKMTAAAAGTFESHDFKCHFATSVKLGGKFVVCEKPTVSPSCLFCHDHYKYQGLVEAGLTLSKASMEYKTLKQLAARKRDASKPLIQSTSAGYRCEV